MFLHDVRSSFSEVRPMI